MGNNINIQFVKSFLSKDKKSIIPAVREALPNIDQNNDWTSCSSHGEDQWNMIIRSLWLAISESTFLSLSSPANALAWRSLTTPNSTVFVETLVSNRTVAWHS